MKGKKGAIPIVLLIAIVMLAGVGTYKMVIEPVVDKIGGGTDAGDQKTLAIEGDDGEIKEVITNPDEKLTEKELTTCNGVQSVNALYNDIDAYNAGTDPSNVTTIYSKDGKDYQKAVVDDATGTTVPVLSSFKALAGNNFGVPLSGYFAEEITFNTKCSDVDIQPDLYPSGAPTLTIVNDDGITKNSDTNHEAMDASTPYTPCITVKAPAEACAARYGALVAFEYNSSAVQSITVSEGVLETTDSSFLVAHNALSPATTALDQYVVKKWYGKNGMLCDSDKVEICYTVKTTSDGVGEDNADMQILWYPLNKDLDAKKLTVITGIYDENNNLISTGNTSVRYHTA